jgi:hypothetical protein
VISTEFDRPVVEPDIPEENCPVLIALDEGRLEITDLAGGVRFDVNRDGVAERNSWSAIGSSWAFAALDHNLNWTIISMGQIDNGGELFGNYTAQRLDEKPRNGYAALAVYDDPANGGNATESSIPETRSSPPCSSGPMLTTMAHRGLSMCFFFTTKETRRRCSNWRIRGLSVFLDILPANVLGTGWFGGLSGQI